MTSQNCVHFYDLHIWLNPLGLQRMVMFTALSPTEIALRMRHILTEDHSRIRSREYREFDWAVKKFLNEAPRMTATEREDLLAKLLAWTPSRRPGRARARGTALPWGLDLQLYYSDSRRLEVRYEERPGRNDPALEARDTRFCDVELVLDVHGSVLDILTRLRNVLCADRDLFATHLDRVVVLPRRRILSDSIYLLPDHQSLAQAQRSRRLSRISRRGD